MDAGIEAEKISNDLCQIGKNYTKFLNTGNIILTTLLNGIKLLEIGKIINPELKDNVLSFSFLNSKYIIAVIQPEYSIKEADLLQKRARLVTYLIKEDNKEYNELKVLNMSFDIKGNIFPDMSASDFSDEIEFIKTYLEYFRNYLLSNESIKTTISFIK